MPTSKNALLIGIDLGGTNMQIGVVDPSNKVLGRAKLKTKSEDGPEAVVTRLVRGMHEACEDAKAALDDVAAVGIASAGAIDIPRGIVINAPNLRWINLPLRDMVQKKSGKKVVLENDVNGAVWGEYVLGPSRGKGDVLGVWVGTGVGGGLVINGRLYYGASWTAGEIGQTILDIHASKGRAKLEELCSRTGMSRTIVSRLHAYPRSVLNEVIAEKNAIAGSKALASAYDAGDELAVEVVNEAADWLGVAIANWVTVLSLGRVIVGGGVTEALGKPYLKRLRAAFERVVFPPELAKCEIIATELEDLAGLLGAALLAREAIEKK
jgi:glucokinase